MQVIINGVRYAPVSESSTSIGIAITTHNRPELLKRALDAQKKHLPSGATVVVVDDGSDTPAVVPSWVKLIRHDTAKGIAAAKNAGIAALVDAGCEHQFLFDDDVWPVAESWWLPYVESDEPHLMLLWEYEFFRSAKLVAHTRPKGCMLYAERRVIDRIGGMDLVFGRWGCEHIQWSDRIFNAGLTSSRYMDVPGSESLFHACDKTLEVKSSVPEAIRLLANTQAAIDGHYADHWLPYRGEQQQPRRIVLSVLVASVGSRRDTFAPRIAEQLFGQHEALTIQQRNQVEIIMLTDAKGMLVGDKRNAMVRLARGEYVVFVDDDDRVEPDYLARLLKATESGADCITFNARVSINGAQPRLCRYSLKYAKDENTATEYHRLPNHITAIKRDIVLRCPFPAKQCGEDSDFAVLVRPMLKTEHALDQVLYYYDYNENTTETQKRPVLVMDEKPVVDVVMLAKGSSEELIAMTQHSIDTCRQNAGDHPVNIVVVEQVPGVKYRDAITIHETDEFAYNRFANNGIKTGSAPWVMVANNDLDFKPGWLDELLKVSHPVMSPRSSESTRQSAIRVPTQGVQNGVHFSGWCFMLSRKLWERIGGLDEDFVYWCADDSVIEQVKRAGVNPTLVPLSVVDHLTSKTGGTTPPDEMTWGQVVIFEKKYGVRKFENDPRYAAYKKRMGAA